MFIAHNEKTSRSVRSGMWLRFVSYKHVVPTGRFARQSAWDKRPYSESMDTGTVCSRRVLTR
jgi:hypothetical protein